MAPEIGETPAVLGVLVSPAGGDDADGNGGKGSVWSPDDRRTDE